jgi:hypothetical protein
MPDEIDEILKFDPVKKQQRPQVQDVIGDILQFDPLKGTEEIESPLPGEQGKTRRIQTEYEPIREEPIPTPALRQPPIAQRPATGIQRPFPVAAERAGFGTLVETGFVDKPETKIDILSKRMGIPKERFGVHKGEIVYLGDDDILYYPTAQTLGGKFKRGIAETVADAPEIALSTAGSTLGPKGTIAGALAGTR